MHLRVSYATGMFVAAPLNLFQNKFCIFLCTPRNQLDRLNPVLATRWSQLAFMLEVTLSTGSAEAITHWPMLSRWLLILMATRA